MTGSEKAQSEITRRAFALSSKITMKLTVDVGDSLFNTTNGFHDFEQIAHAFI